MPRALQGGAGPSGGEARPGGREGAALVIARRFVRARVYWYQWWSSGSGISLVSQNLVANTASSRSLRNF